MRIIGGNLKRKKLVSPPEGAITRPMPDRVRESIYNLLRGHFEGETVVDVFCGTGPVGLEAVSRGAKEVAFVERDKRVVKALEKNITELGVADRTRVVAGDALSPVTIKRLPKSVHVAFFDPPYPMVEDPETWPKVRDAFARIVGLLDEKGYAILRTPWPFTHLVTPPRPERAEPAEDEKTVIDLGSEDADDELDRFEEMMTGSAPEPEKVREPVDLAIPGAIGPETHVYRFTAVHLYMRQPAEASPGEEAPTEEAPGGTPEA